LFSVARNLLLQHRRSERVELRACQRLGIALVIDETLFEDVDSRLAARSSRDALEAALAGLSAGQQDIVRRVVLLEESPAEAAAALGLEPAAARMRLSRALRAMRTYLQQSGTA
jgi:RNA polymerase sigma-70 factor (ECF subfamily)